MPPTPASHSSFTDNFRFRSRRQRHTNPYDPTPHTTPTQAHAQPSVTPLVDEDDGDGGGAEDEASDAELEDEDIEDVEADLDDEHQDVEEEEGGIEEGLFHISIHSVIPTLCFHKAWSAFPASSLSYTQICLPRAHWTWCKANLESTRVIGFRDHLPVLLQTTGLHNTRALLIVLNHQCPWTLILHLIPMS